MKVKVEQGPHTETATVTISGDVHQLKQLAEELNKAGNAQTPRVANLGNELTHQVDQLKK